MPLADPGDGEAELNQPARASHISNSRFAISKGVRTADRKGRASLGRRPARIPGRRFFRDNGLSIALTLLFGALLFGHSVAGHRHHNEELRADGQGAVAHGEYLRSGDFLESVFENWESEFFQMAFYSETGSG